MASVLIPQQAQAPTQKKRSDFSKIFEQAAPIVGSVVGGIYGGPAGASAGGALGKQFGGQIGDTFAPPSISGGGMETIGYKAANNDANALSRRAEMQVKDPITALKEAQAALAVRSPDEQKEYGPVLNQAILEARRQKGVMA